MQPKITIILRSYNRAKWLNRAIESVVNQTFEDWELIIADDGSSCRETIKAIYEWAETDDRIKSIIQHKNFGNVTRGTNDALDIAQGKFISFLDDDNFYMPIRFEEMLKKQAENNYDIIYSLSFIGNLEGNIQAIHRFGKKDKFDYEQMKRQNFIDSMELLIRKNIFDEVGYFKEDLSTSEDWDMLLRIFHKPRNLGFLEIPLQYYSQHPARRMFHTTEIDKINVAKIYRDLDIRQRKQKIYITSDSEDIKKAVFILPVLSDKILFVDSINDNILRNEESEIFKSDLIIGIMPLSIKRFFNRENINSVLICNKEDSFESLNLDNWQWIATDSGIKIDDKKMIYCNDHIQNNQLLIKILQLVEADRFDIII